MVFSKSTGSSLVGICEAAKVTGLSAYMLRKGIKTGRFPAIQMADKGKYLLDLRLLSEVLATEAMDNINNDKKTKKLTEADCLPKSNEAEWEGKLLIIKPERLHPEYQFAEHQLVICAGGFGASPNARGRAVFVKELCSGEKTRYERFDIAGIADISKLPEWVQNKLMSMEYREDVEE